MSELDREAYRELNFLVIDDQAAARQSLRICAQTMGAFSVEFSSSYQDAIGRIRRRQPDVILCDYMLGDGRSGQLLLEELRRHALLADETAFMMVTAEQAYEQVVAAVELAPDDYIIKPFSPERLKFRLDRVLMRKRFFRPYYEARRERDYATALRFIAEHLARDDAQRYRFELLRQRAELELERGNSANAHDAFDAILALHPFPWAKAGKARSLLRQNRLQEARELVEQVVDASPMYFDAFDLKTRICMEMGDYEEARRTVQHTSARTRRNYLRKRLLADTALRAGDAQTAREAITDVLDNDLTPGAISIADRLMLVRTLLAGGDLAGAEAAMAKLPAAQMATAGLDDKASWHALMLRIDPEGHAAQFGAQREVWKHAELNIDAQVDIVQAAFARGDAALAESMVKSMLADDNVRRVFRQVRDLFDTHGMSEAFRSVQRQVALERIGGPGSAPAGPGSTAPVAAGDTTRPPIETRRTP